MTKVKKSLTGEAIVAGENNSENFNEQVETAPVINQLNNEETIMEETVFQSSMVPQAGACETTPGSGVKETATVSDNKTLNTFNEWVVDSVIDYDDPRLDHKVIDEHGYINLFPSEVWCISVNFFDSNDSKYSFLNTLPDELLPFLSPQGTIHGIMELEYPFDPGYVVEFDFKTTNDILTMIRKGFIEMYDSLDGYEVPYGDDIRDSDDLPYGEPTHDFDSLIVEELSFNPKNNSIKVYIGSL